MPLVSLVPRSTRYLSFAEREEIAILKAEGAGLREIARRIGRAPSTVSREVRRNAATRSGASSIGRQLPSGIAIDVPSARNSPSSRPINGYVATWRSV